MWFLTSVGEKKRSTLNKYFMKRDQSLALPFRLVNEQIFIHKIFKGTNLLM